MHILRVVHRWTGIVIAIPVVLVALSGGLLLFKAPYHRWLYPQLARPIAAAERAGYGEVVGRIERDFNGLIRVVRFPRDGSNAFLVYLSDGSEAFIDPTSGGLIARWQPHESLPAFLFQVHAHLLAGVPGEVVNGFLALLLVFLGLTGVVLWWPRRATAFRIARAVPRSVAPGDILRSHAATGVLLALPVILFAATGAGLVFYEPASRIATALFDARAPEVPSARVPPSTAPRRGWPEILAAVRRALPEAEPTMYYPGGEANAVLTFRKSLPREWHPNGRSYVLVDPYRATVVQAIDARTQGAGTRLMHALYPVHAAMVGGSGLVLLALIAALGLMYLAIGGPYAFLARRARARRSVARPSVARRVPRSPRSPTPGPVR